MEQAQLQQLKVLQHELMSLVYKHREGGRYAYVKLLSLLRDFPPLIEGADADDLYIVQRIAAELNERLTNTFTAAEERFFEVSRTALLRVIAMFLARLNCADPVTAGR